ncbi:MAG: DUF2318 domain-containing protein [Deltaproteobacteria bacterium]|jgi:uncharacterized membrane protein|nr:DUF2318 domain-containing protein [Deltaproteobacteria bacterium]
MRVIILLITSLALAWAAPAQAFFGLTGNAKTVAARDGQITLDASSLDKGQARHYRYQEGNTEVRFFLVRDNQGTVRVALDACEVCWHADKGYTLRDGVMVCVNCGQRFPLSRIGMARGGCNPHPVAFDNNNDTLHISSRELLDGAHYFSKNKPGTK